MSELCPQCGGRKVIAVGTDEVSCAECGGTGKVKTGKAKADDKPAASDSR
jgi:DnaJ-class molecular chaperone